MCNLRNECSSTVTKLKLYSLTARVLAFYFIRVNNSPKLRIKCVVAIITPTVHDLPGRLNLFGENCSHVAALGINEVASTTGFSFSYFVINFQRITFTSCHLRPDCFKTSFAAFLYRSSDMCSNQVLAR